MSTPQRDEIDWVPVYNTTAETIPSGALARVTGVTDGVFQLAKPNADSDTTVIVVGRHAIPADRYGRGTFDPRVIAAYDYADDTPAAGDQMGSANGSWYLTAGNTGFYVIGGGGNGLVNAIRVQVASPLSSGSGVPSGAYAITANNTWENTGTSITLPGSGTYLVAMTVGGQATVDGSGKYLAARLYDTTNSAALDGTEVYFANPIFTSGTTYIAYGNASAQRVVTVTGSTTIRLEAFRTSGTWTTSNIYGPISTRLTWVRLY